MRGTTTRCRLLGSALLPALMLLLALPAGAQEQGQAGLVVQFGADRFETRCLEVAAAGVTGVDLLNASGLVVVADVSSGMGISVCQIEGQGCAYPAQHCFCQCMGGGECAYWNYFYREPGADTWTYSPLGAVLRTVLPGSVEAWVWGDGHAPPPADLSFEAICQVPAATEAVMDTATPLATATTQPAAIPQAAGEATPLPVASPTRTPAPPAGATPAAAGETSDDAGSSAGGYVAFGAMLLLLAAVGAVTWLRRH